MKKMGDFTEESSDVKSLEQEKYWDDEATFPDELKKKVFIKHIKGPIFFGSTSHFQALAKQVPESASHVIIRMEKVPYIDQSGLYAMEDILLNLEKKNIHQLIVGLQNQPAYLMQSIDIIPDLIPEEHLFDDFKDCTTWIKNNI
jgi:SulP family sulfate permease